MGDIVFPEPKVEAVYHTLNCANTDELEHILGMLIEFKWLIHGYTYWEENNCQKSYDWLVNLINNMRRLEEKRLEENKKNGY